MSESLELAMRYARRGWAVFPYRPGSKEPATVHGVHDAGTDAGRIERFWRRRPDMNVAVATGGNGPDVLDVDVAQGNAAKSRCRRRSAPGWARQDVDGCPAIQSLSASGA